MTREIFRNAPLVEMIAEVRWRLTPVTAVPNGAIDPFYDTLKIALKERLSLSGFTVVREKVPPEIPREFLAGQVTTQFCLPSSASPLYQLGPGVFTVNITESYKGWDSFRASVRLGIEQLLAAHPALQIFQIDSLKLLAIDAFSKRHNYQCYSDFSKRYLTLTELLPSSFLKEFASDMDAVNVRSDTTFPLNQPKGSRAQISINDGLQNSENALILQTAIEINSEIPAAHAEIMEWFDEAHQAHRTMFRKLLSDELLEILQPEKVQ